MRRREFLAGAAASSVLLPSAAEAMLGTRRVALLGRVRYDPAAQAIFNAFTTPPTAARKAIINNCVLALKAAGIWSLFDLLYFTAAADSQAARINWVNPGTFTLSAVNSPAFVADRGFTGDGASSYLDPGFTPSTNAVQWTLNSAHISGWSLTSIGAGSNAQRLVGNSATTTARSALIPWNATNQVAALLNDLSGSTISNSTSLGDFIANRSAVSSRQIYLNGASLGSDATASVALPPNALYFGRDTVNFASLQMAALSVGASLSSGQVASFYAARQSYLHAVGAV
jgi:hypothetical protein